MINLKFIILLCFCIILSFSCSINKENLNQKISRLIDQTNVKDSISVEIFVSENEEIGQKSIPILLSSWDKGNDYKELKLITETIIRIGDSTLYNNLNTSFAQNQNIQVKQAAVNVLMNMYIYEILNDKYYGVPKPDILAIPLYSMADTTLVFPNPHMSNLAMLSAAIFQLLTSDMLDDEVIYEMLREKEYSNLKEFLLSWYNTNKTNIEWDKTTRKFKFIE